MAITTAVLTGGVNNHETTSEEINAVYTDFASEGVVGTLANTSGVAPATGGFAVNAQGTPDATVAVTAGVAYVTGTPTSQSSQTFRVKNTATENVTISANASGSTKYDWVYIKLDPTNLNAPNTAGDNAATLVTSRSSSSTSDDGTPPTYGLNIAVVTVANGFSTITNGNISDTRTQTGMTPTQDAQSTASWTSLGATPSSIVDNGNRSYSLTFTGTDLTDTISNGMRLKLTRTVTAPTQCTDLESSSSQYYFKATPAGMTFTDDFVVSAWIKLESYAAGTIASRFNGTSGWIFQVNASGQLTLTGYNAGAGNARQVISYQSVPLNKWVHVTAQLDMSAYTVTTTTCYVMIDGLDVPASLVQAGTNPTALIQAGDLQIGAQNGSVFFDGKIAQVAIYSAKVTQATIKASRDQTLAGTETSLISAYSFNNTIDDLNTTNANNLTASGSAVATNADSPFAGGNVQEYTDGTTEMGIIVSNTFSTDTTVVVQVPEGYALPTTGGISAVSYSSQKVPYGFPSAKGKWTVETLSRVGSLTVSPVNGTWYNAISLSVPIGSWSIAYTAPLYGDRVGSAAVKVYATLSTANNTELDKLYTSTLEYNPVLLAYGQVGLSRDISTNAQTLYYLNYSAQIASISNVGLLGDRGSVFIKAENAYI